MVRMYPLSSMITPLPSRTEPRLALLRASGSARVLTLTTDPSSSSACFSLMTLGFCCTCCAWTGSPTSTAQSNTEAMGRCRKSFILASCCKTASSERLSRLQTRNPDAHIGAKLNRHEEAFSPVFVRDTNEIVAISPAPALAPGWPPGYLSRFYVEKTMPLIHVEMFEGRTQEIK